MTNLTIYNGANTQEIYLSGLKDYSGATVANATITGSVVQVRSGNVFTGGNIAFTSVANIAGDYSGTLTDFDATAGPAHLIINGNTSSDSFKYTVFATIAERSL